MNSLATATRNQFISQHFANIPETQTQVPILFYVIHIHNISKSRLNQLDQWKEYEDPNSVSVDRVSKSKGKSKRGSNKVITLVEMDSENGTTNLNANTGWSSNDVYKLVLKDNFDNYCYAYEYDDKLSFIRTNNNSEIPLSISLGGRLIVNKGTTIMNGMLMLKNINCQYLGIDERDTRLFQTLNSNLVGKYISVLKNELKLPEKT